MELITSLEKILPGLEGLGRNGTFYKQELILISPDDTTKKICVINWNNRVSIEDLIVGHPYQFKCIIESHEFNKKWYTHITLKEVNEIPSDIEITENQDKPILHSANNFTDLRIKLDLQNVRGLKLNDKTKKRTKNNGKNLGTLSTCFGKECKIGFIQDELESIRLNNLTLVINDGQYKIKCSRSLSESIKKGIFQDNLKELRQHDIVQFENNKIYVVDSSSITLADLLSISKDNKDNIFSNINRPDEISTEDSSLEEL